MRRRRAISDGSIVNDRNERRLHTVINTMALIVSAFTISELDALAAAIFGFFGVSSLSSAVGLPLHLLISIVLAIGIGWLYAWLILVAAACPASLRIPVVLAVTAGWGYALSAVAAAFLPDGGALTDPRYREAWCIAVMAAAMTISLYTTRQRLSVRPTFPVTIGAAAIAAAPVAAATFAALTLLSLSPPNA